MTEFTVRGSGDFPIDMLRYDAAYPASSADAAAIQRSFNRDFAIIDRRWEITLQTNQRHAPTVARWQSFGVRVVKGG